MHLTHLIIDDFFDKPMMVRDAALKLDYPPRPEKAQYPGRNASGPLPLQGIERMISKIVHEPLQPVTENASHAIPRLALEGDEAQNIVHYDVCHWSGIVCLSLNEHVKGGTIFKKHKPTGYDRLPIFPGEPEKLGYPTANDAAEAMQNHGDADPQEWEALMEIPMKFNRLVLFRGYLWHDAGEAFGTSPETGRLILPMFFENPSANAS